MLDKLFTLGFKELETSILMLRANQLQADRAFVLVVDIQEKLLPAILHHESIVFAGCKLLEVACVFNLPVIATEQYPQGLGKTESRTATCIERCHAQMFEKATFSVCDEPEVRAAINQINRPQVIVIGIEAHVCVQQSALDLCAQDYDVFVCADAIGSRGKTDYEISLSRMRQEGAYVTTVESVLFEMCNRCDTHEFKDMLKVIKAMPPAN